MVMQTLYIKLAVETHTFYKSRAFRARRGNVTPVDSEELPGEGR
jgi:hypothetical protein